jgi:peptidylprolyl isomerase
MRHPSLHPLRHPLRVSLLVGAALALTACASDQGDEPAAGEPAAPAASGAATAPDANAILDALYPERGEPPGELVITDLTEGDGPAVSAGQRAVVQYWGLRWSDGGTFDSSWSRGQPFTFALGAGQVITGWDVGVDGMRVGGRRVLVIPPGLAYGDRGAGNVIGPGETLVFIVDLVDTDGS